MANRHRQESQFFYNTKLKNKTYLKIIVNIWSSVSARNKADLLNNSAMMQPAAQISHGDEYSDCTRISGERYQSVTTIGVNADSHPSTRDKPKSVIFNRFPSRSINIFAGFKSRWMIRCACRKSVPRKSWYDKFWRLYQIITVYSNLFRAQAWWGNNVGQISCQVIFNKLKDNVYTNSAVLPR